MLTEPVPLTTLAAFLGPADSESRWIGMIGAFVDESGTHRGTPVVVVAVYAAPTSPIDHWAGFRSEWTSRVLDGDETTVLHMKEAIQRLGRDPQWDGRLEAAAKTIASHTLIRMACAIDVAAHKNFVEAWRQRMPKGYQPETAYAFGVTTCLAEVAQAVTDAGLDDWITYIFEQGHKNFGQVRVILDDLIAQPQIRKQVRLWTYAPERKEDRQELQAADFFAYWLREYAEAVDYRRESANLHPITYALGSVTHSYVYWDAARFAAYLDVQEEAERELRRQWWKGKIRSDRERRGREV